jgi:hypothetical protein
VIKYKQGKKTLWLMHFRAGMFFYLLRMLDFGFEHIKELYKDDSDFANVYNVCETLDFEKFYILDGYLFKESRLCVP